MTTIFHPTDFSPASDAAFRHALRLALALRGRLVVMHVDSGRKPEGDWARFPHVRETLARWGMVDPGMSPGELETETGLAVTKIGMHGTRPAQAIAAWLEAHDADLVVMATHGASGPLSWFDASVTRQAGRLVRQPVLILREGVPGFVGVDGAFRLRRVLVPVDRDPDPQLAIDWVSRLQQWIGTPIGAVEALHVGAGPLDPPVHPPHLGGGTFRQIVEQGTPETVIAGHADRFQADLVVMSRAGPASLAERLIGSTTERVVLDAPCPVLAVPEFGYVG